MKIDKNRDCIEMEFDGYQDIANYVKNIQDDSRSKNSEWSSEFCPFTWNESINSLNNGWPEGIRDIDNISANIQDKIESDNSYTVLYDVTGNFIDIGSYLEGTPECMGNIETTEGPKKDLDITVHIGSRHDIQSDTIKYRGGAISAIIDHLRKEHYVHLKLIHYATKINNLYTIKVIINVNTQNEYSRDLLAYYIANSGFKRRLIFGMYEIALNTNNTDTGQSNNLPEKPEGLHFPLIQEYDWNSFDKSTDKAKEIIGQYNNDNK